MEGGARCPGPCVFRVEAGGKYAFCRCRRSAHYPKCDGSHRFLDPPSSITPLKVIAEASGEFAWCGCGQTSRAPDCDRSTGCPAAG
ncbi:MAG: CDGSH iron-sulfur domain-containing protein [Planctomycetes bacterium]|nr:CDGSH iron-sulfur domain-containing protein [Planctomycetota bacterium]MCB9870567.1 CDGSH iron-sulfur domain-containing protein [Planctomycetota bacterium]